MENELFVVEKILAERVDGGEFLVQWKDYPLDECSWEPRSHMYHGHRTNDSEDITWVQNMESGELSRLRTHLIVEGEWCPELPVNEKDQRPEVSELRVDVPVEKPDCELYSVEKILKKRRDYGIWMYQAKFKNFNHRYNRWLPLENMTLALQNEIKNIHDTLPTGKRVKRLHTFAR